MLDGMFERFGETARRAIALAQDEARALGHAQVGTEHLLSGLARTGGPPARVLGRLGVTPGRVRERLVAIAPPGDAPSPAGRIPFSPRARAALQQAPREALAMGGGGIDGEHLLLGLVADPDSVAARILTELHAPPERVRQGLIRSLAMVRGARSVGVHAAGRTAPQARVAPPLDWRRATILWRPAGDELRVPLHLGEGALAAFAADPVWAQEPLRGLRREIRSGWLALSSPTLLDGDPALLRAPLDAAARRASATRGREQGRIEDFLRALARE